MSGRRIVAEHIMKKTLSEYLHYPGHHERYETKEFRNSKNELENIEHLPCYKCGTHEHLESHHIFERAWAQGLDFKKVAFFLFNHFDFHGHCHRDFKSHDELLQFFIVNYNGKSVKEDRQNPETGDIYTVEYITCDDAALDTIYNQWILCHTDHNNKYTGVHDIDGASFFSSLVVNPDFVNIMTQKQATEWEKEHQNV